MESTIEYVKAWQCIGCGKIEAPQTCVGICRDVRVEFVYAADYEAALARVEEVRAHVATLEGIVRQLATITPRDGEWERSYRALQARARQALARYVELAGDPPRSGPPGAAPADVAARASDVPASPESR
ncbi:MAG: hypothetical protein IT516_08075 [Burkholderiales bacterium]|nr:hypothetical protein [Burkholderiales bacterium]